MRIVTTFHNSNPNTIWNTLARKLGHEPTNAEAAAEVRRIMLKATATATSASSPWTGHLTSKASASLSVRLPA